MRSARSGIRGCNDAPSHPPARPPRPHATPRDQSGETGPVASSEITAYVATPTIDVTQVESSAAGATVATAIPVPTRIGPITDPPPMPYRPPTIPTPNASAVTARGDRRRRAGAGVGLRRMN